MLFHKLRLGLDMCNGKGRKITRSSSNRVPSRSNCSRIPFTTWEPTLNPNPDTTPNPSFTSLRAIVWIYCCALLSSHGA